MGITQAPSIAALCGKAPAPLGAVLGVKDKGR
jgi:hypothetical protein